MNKHNRPKSPSGFSHFLALIAIFFGLPALNFVLSSGDPKPFSSLDLNSRGDFLAGLFGPLAFLAAAIAIFLQSRELAAQREILELTKDEMAEQRKATQEMASTLTEQTNILIAEGEQRQAEVVFREFEQRVDAVKIAMVDIARAPNVLKVKGSQFSNERIRALALKTAKMTTTITGFDLSAALAPGDENDNQNDVVPRVEQVFSQIKLEQNSKFFVDLRVYLSELVEILRPAVKEFGVETPSPHRSQYEHLLLKLLEVQAMQERVSKEYLIKFQNLRIHEIVDKLRTLLKLEIWNGETP